jgi:hypothetical protein
MSDANPDRNKASEEEREDARLAEIVRTKLPLPNAPSSTDRAAILQYVNSEPSLTTFRKNGLERFLANVAVMPDGRVICTLTSRLDEHYFLLPLLWGSQFGMCLRLIVRTQTIPIQAVFIPGQLSFDALGSNRLIFVSYRMGRVQAINEFNLSSSIEVRSAFGTLIARCAPLQAEIIRDDSYIDSPDLIRAHSVSEKLFSDHWTRLEWLQRGWINACGERHRRAAGLVKERLADILYASQMPELRKHYDLLHATISTLSKSDLPISSKIREVIARYKNGSIRSLLVEGIAFADEQTSLDAKAELAFRRATEVAFELWHLLEIDPTLSDWGRRQISWDSFGKDSEAVEIDPQNFPIEQDKDAALYWECKRPEILAHRNQLLSASDFPLDVASFVDGLADWHVDLDANEAKETITHLLNEAVALREWTIPPNGFVEVSIGPFVGVEVTEAGGDVYFIWRTANNRYWDMLVGTEKQTFANTHVFARDPHNPFNEKAELAICLLMSAIIRDFWVVTERQKVFGVKVRRTERRGSQGVERRVVYLPRVRYLESKIDLTPLNLGLSYEQRSQHYVRPHFRMANPSLLQLEIAKRARRIVPEGHTYVQGHYRGVEGTAGQTVYRSRSALALLFEASQSELNQPDHLSLTDWFGFERAVSILLEKNFNFTISHRSTRGKTDYGIDILATKPVGTQIETWVVQCKCYKPSHLVGPSYMRELVGSIADLRSDGVARVRGMMVTTSRISGDALTLAVKHGIQCVTGDDLKLILDSINRATESNSIH